MTHPGLAGTPIYLDYNATTPVDPLVLTALVPYLTTHFGNPSSTHPYGQAPRTAIEMARGQLAALLGCSPTEIVFTGCGSESNSLAILGAATARRSRGDHVITQVTEHPAVLSACSALQRLYGFRVTYLPVDRLGWVDPGDLAAVIDDSTVLVSVMYANNETGTLQPVAELAEIAHRYGALMHTDAAQSVGKLPTLVLDLGADLLTVAGHKLYAPKGAGALYVRRGVTLEPIILGGGQESGRRSGTENVAFAVGLGAAAALAQEHTPDDGMRLRLLRDELHRRLDDLLPGRVRLNGHPDRRLPNTLNVSIDGVTAATVLNQTPGVAAATGSACHAGDDVPSPVLTAMGLSGDRARAAFRLTLGRWSTAIEIEHAALLLAETIRQDRASS